MWLYSFFFWNYEQGINLPEGRRWHCIAEFTSNLFNFFLSWCQAGGKRHSLTTFPLSFILFFPSGIGCWSSGSTRLWKQWWWEVFPWQVCLLKTDSIILGGALPGPVCWAHPFPSALTHTASFCEPGKCHCDENWSLGRTRLKRPLNS